MPIFEYECSDCGERCEAVRVYERRNKGKPKCQCGAVMKLVTVSKPARAQGGGTRIHHGLTGH